jgi:FKBP12-rapamycin complex-associated protein
MEQHDPLESIFRGLESKSHDVRLQHAIQLRNYVGLLVSVLYHTELSSQVATTVAEMSPDVAGKVWDNVNQAIFDLMHSQHNERKLGGLLAMSALFLPGSNLSSLIFVNLRSSSSN